MKLSDLLAGQPYRCVAGTAEKPVLRLTHDSRASGPGCLFFCLPGRHKDGHDFAGEAAARGAAAIVAERPVPLPPGVTLILVPNARLALALAAATFWGRPASKLRLLTVTGTNGKTTVNQLVEAALRAEGRPTGLIGTVENHIGPVRTPSDLTTPDALELQASLAAMVSAGLTHACVEVSSHGLAGYRLAGSEVDVAALTNVARDHLDFHGDVNAYAATKLSLFRGLSGPRAKPGPVYAVLNADDSFFEDFRRKITVPVLAYGAMRPGHVKLLGAATGAAGSAVRVAFRSRPRGLPAADWLAAADGWPEEAALFFPHPGRHNVRNLLAALTVAWAEGCRWESARRAAETFPGVRGRWEVVTSPDGVTGVVDFAHNPGGLVQALETARLAARRRVILVFGCEGQEDRGKRPVMGAIAARLADHVVVTTDNTSCEDGRQILADIESGLAAPEGAGAGAWLGGAGAGASHGARATTAPRDRRRATYEVVPDRREAIFRAAALAEPGDLVVVAGRGHDVKLVFGSRVEILDDRAVLEEALRAQPRAADGEARGAPEPYSHSMVEGGLEVTS